MKTRDEKTSKRVSAIAGRVLARIEALRPYAQLKTVALIESRHSADSFGYVCTHAELKALAASCLTQAPNRPKPARILICGNCLRKYDASKAHKCQKPARKKAK